MNGAMFRQPTFIRTSSSLLFVIGSAVLATTLLACAHMPWAARDAGVAGPATVMGQVTSDRGAIIVDAAITLTGPSVRRSARTDIAGRFSFERVPIGRYVVSAAATGFKHGKQTVAVDKEGTIRADLKLKM